MKDEIKIVKISLEDLEHYLVSLEVEGVFGGLTEFIEELRDNMFNSKETLVIEDG